MSATDVGALRRKLWTAGFRAVPLLTGQKYTTARGWSDDARRDPPASAIAPATPDYLNTGLLCDGLRVVDLDVDDPATVGRLRKLAEHMFGLTPTRTRENSPRCALLYRAADGSPPKRTLSGEGGKIEVLGHGQQLHAFGVHPSGSPLHWDTAPGCIRRDDLPAVTEAQMTDFLTKAATLIGATMSDRDALSSDAMADAATYLTLLGSNLGATADSLDVAAALAVIPNDGPADWEAWNRVGMATWAATGGSLSGLAAWAAWSERNSAYDAKAVSARWQHYKASPPTRIGAGTLFHLAKKAQSDWRKPTEAVAPTLSRPDGIRLLSPEDCGLESGRPYVIKGMLAQRDVACIFGPPGAGKSVIAPHLAYALAQGRLVFGRRTRQGGAFYVAAEDAHGMRQRVHGLKLAHGDAPGFALVDGVSSLLESGQANELRALVAQYRPVLVVVDTLAMAFPGLDENTSQAMSTVVALARSLTEHGAAVVLIHHDTKEGTGTPRGHSILNGALDVSLQLGKADDSGIIRGKLVKNRNGPCDAMLAFRIRSDLIGDDEDGDAVTAPVAAEVESAGLKRTGKLPRAAAGALYVLREMIVANDGRPIAEHVWRDACVGNPRVSAAPERKSQVTAFTRAYANLIDKRFIASVAGLVSLLSEEPEFDSLLTDSAVGDQTLQTATMSPL
jgi:hypothetical protein